MQFKGLYFVASDDNGYRIGQIVDTVTDGTGVGSEKALVVRYEPPQEDPPSKMPLEVLPLFALWNDDCGEEDHVHYMLFETRAELDEWLAWVERPVDGKPREKVVKLVREDEGGRGRKH